MSFVVTQTITLDGTGTEIPALNIISSVQEYCLIGSVIATGNYSLVATGTPKEGSQIIIKYGGSLNITTNSKTFSIFGVNITQNVLATEFDAECLYFGGTWNIIIKPNIIDYVIDPSAIPDNSITTNKIVNANVTMAKLANNSVGTANIVDLNITTNKLADNSVSTAKMATHSVDSTIITNNAVITNAIVDAAVTNAKLVAGPNNSIKVTGVSAVQDLTLLNNQVIGRLAGGLQAIPLSSLRSGEFEIFTVPVSFESGEQSVLTVYLPYACIVVNIMIAAISNIANTDNGIIAVADANGISTPIQTMVVPASTSAGAAIPYTAINYNYLGAGDTGIITIFSSKVTPGGRVLLSFVVQRT